VPPVNNVLDFTRHFERRRLRSLHTVFYINERGRWNKQLTLFQSLRVLDIRSVDSLRSGLCENQPDLILLESDLSWADAIEVSRDLVVRMEVPIVMLWNRRSNVSRKAIKNAYAAGVTDMLLPPFDSDDISETLDVLLKYQRQVTSMR